MTPAALDNITLTLATIAVLFLFSLSFPDNGDAGGDGLA